MIGKRIMVTGHNGFIGTILVKFLLGRGFDVVGLDTDYYDKECEFFDQQPSLKELKKDLRHIDERDIEGCYAICHLGALSNDPMGEIDPELTYEINYHASVRLARMAKKVGVAKFIYSSSCSLYGKAEGDDAISEEGQLNPLTAYAKSKVFAEKELFPLADDRFSFTSLRNATAYGISSKLRVDLVVNNLVGWAVTTGQIRIMSDGSPWRPLIHAEDIAGAFIAAIEAPVEKVNGQAFNVGVNSENFRIREIAALVKEVIPSCHVVITGEHGADSRSYRVNFDKIKNALPNFNPQWTLKKGIEQIYEYFRKYGMNQERFNGRYFIRLKQLQYLLSSKRINEQLFWNP